MYALMLVLQPLHVQTVYGQYSVWVEEMHIHSNTISRGIDWHITTSDTLVCNTFTPQIKGIPEDTFAMCLQGDI